jgi:hypothetical protein
MDMILAQKIKKGLSLLSKITAVLFFILGLAAIIAVFSLKSLQQMQFDSAARYAQWSNKLLKPFRFVTLYRLHSLEAVNHGLEVIQLLPNLEKTFQETFASLSAFADPTDADQSTDQLISQDLIAEINTLSQAYDSFFFHLQKSWLLNIFLDDHSQQKLEQLNHNLPILKRILTHYQKGEHNVVLLLQNNDEIRASGGFMGSIAAFSLQDGKMTDPIFYDIYDLSNQITETSPAPPGVYQYLSEGRGLALTDANWQADFSQAAQDIISLLDQTILPETDLLIALNLDFVKNLLSITGPIYLPNLESSPQTVTPENLNNLARQQRIEFFAGDKQKKHFLGQLYTALKLQLAQIDQTQLIQLMTMLSQTTRNKNILLYSKNLDIQSLFVKANLTGTINPNTDYFFYLVESNVGINKANQGVERNITLAINQNLVSFALEFSNHNSPLTEKEVALIQNNPDLMQATHLGYVNYQRLLTNLPILENSIKVSCDEQPIDLEESRTVSIWEGSVTQLGFLVTVAERSHKKCVLSFKPQQPLLEEKTWTLLKQPGLPDTSYQLNIFEDHQQKILNQDLIFSMNGGI